MRRRIGILDAAPLVGGDRVDLVVDLDARHFDRADLFEDARHRGHVTLALGIRRVDDVQHEIRVGGFFERGAKRRDQRVRQAIDEADRVAQQQLAPIGKIDAPAPADRA